MARRIEKSVAAGANFSPQFQVPSLSIPSTFGLFETTFSEKKNRLSISLQSPHQISDRPTESRYGVWSPMHRSVPEGDVVVVDVALEEAEGGDVAVEEVAVAGHVIGGRELVHLVEEITSRLLEMVVEKDNDSLQLVVRARSGCWVQRNLASSNGTHDPCSKISADNN